MIKTIILFLCCTIIFSQQVYELKDGTKVDGVIISESDTEFIIETSLGKMTILKSDILPKLYIVTLQSDETIIGEKLSESDSIIKLKTKYGELEIIKENIKSILEKSEVKEAKKTPPYRRSYSVVDYLFGGYTLDKNTDFSLGEEQLVDLFFDPTGYTLKQSTLYLSGLSFGFGVTDRFQITTKWGNFFWGDMNLRPKYKVFEKGNWENQHSLSIGAHYHSRWWPNKYEWKNGTININGDDKYWGGYYLINENPLFELKDESFIERIDETDDEFVEMVELFGAYTFSQARPGLKGRISHTIGGNVQFFTLDKESKLLKRAYYGLDVDINAKLKMIGEVFYDPYFLEMWQIIDSDMDMWDENELSDSIVEEPSDASPVHLDFGFIYAFNESFRFGLHFQRPFVSFYWKF